MKVTTAQIREFATRFIAAEIAATGDAEWFQPQLDATLALLAQHDDSAEFAVTGRRINVTNPGRVGGDFDTVIAMAGEALSGGSVGESHTTWA